MADLIDLREDKSYDKALSLAEKHLETAMKSSGDLADYLPVAMIEAAVNQSAEIADPAYRTACSCRSPRTVRRREWPVR